jgi:hypothetical protein
MATSLASENRANRAAAAQKLSLEADKAAAQADAAKQAVRAAKATLKRTRKLAKASKKIAKQARKRAKAAVAELHGGTGNAASRAKPAAAGKKAPAAERTSAKIRGNRRRPAVRQGSDANAERSAAQAAQSVIDRLDGAAPAALAIIEG